VLKRCVRAGEPRRAFKELLGFYRYARDMFRRAAKNLFLAAIALVLGLTLGAVTKFGLGYDLAADASPAKIVAKN